MSRPHPIRLLSVALLLSRGPGAQAPARRPVDVPAVAPRAADVATVDGIVKAYYDVITGPAGQPRQWSRDRSLYIADLRFVATGVGKQGPYARVMDHQAFVDGSDSSMVHDGFFEREVHRVTRSYGNIVQVFSTIFPYDRVTRWTSRSKNPRSEEHTSELQSQSNLVCRLLLEKKKQTPTPYPPKTSAPIRIAALITVITFHHALRPLPLMLAARLVFLVVWSVHFLLNT